MKTDIDKKVIEDQEEIESLATDYLREISSLSKIFITLSIAMLGLAMSKVSPEISKSIGNTWIILTWFFLVLSAFFGFMEIFFFSRRFKKKSDYIQSCLRVAVVLHLKQPEAKLQEFTGKMLIDKESLDHHYNWCIFTVTCQAILLLLAFILFGIFVLKSCN